MLASSCGDPSPPYDEVTSSDARFVLRAAVDSVAGDPCVCDVNGSGEVSATDALVVLRSAVGLDILLTCPSCG